MDMLEANNAVREFLTTEKIPNNRSQKMKGMYKIDIIDYDPTNYYMTLFFF
jgi:hypothetical protein